MPLRECLENFPVVYAEVLRLEFAGYQCGITVEYERRALGVAFKRVIGNAEMNAFQNANFSYPTSRTVGYLARKNVAQDGGFVFCALWTTLWIAASTRLEPMLRGRLAVPDLRALSFRSRWCFEPGFWFITVLGHITTLRRTVVTSEKV
jgi:hypothetical protein